MLITFETYTDKWHYDITDFRNKVCQELGANDAQEMLSHKQTLEKYKKNNFAEEIYKFSNKKWDQTHFDSIETIKLESKIVGISGCAIYGNTVRILMHRYSLHSARLVANTYTWHKGGVIDRHLEYAIKNNKSALFFTIYEHNATLNTFVKYLRKKKYNKNKPLLGKFDELPGGAMVNNTMQSVFYYNIDSNYSFSEKDLQ
jgi:hypothetical protein